MLAKLDAVPAVRAVLVLSLVLAGCGAPAATGLLDNDLVAASRAARSTANAQVLPPAARWADALIDPAPFCAAQVNDTRDVVVPRIEKPSFGVPYVDPAFGSRVTRITQAREGEVFKPAYSTVQAWNADESLLMLYRGGLAPAHVLLDGHSYDFVAELDIQPSDIEEVWWSHTDPSTFFYISKSGGSFGTLMQFDVPTGRAHALKSLQGACGAALPTGGNDVQMQSLDDDLFGFRCRDADGDARMLGWRRSTDTLFERPSGEGTDFHPWSAPIPSPAGDAFWLQGRVLSADLVAERVRHDLYKPSEHASIGLTVDGDGALFTTVFDPSPDGCDGDPADGVGHLVMHRLDDGSCQPIINEAMGYPYTTSGTHVSARASGAPGRVALSSIGYGSLDLLDARTAAPALFSEVYLADANPDAPRVCRLAHHRSFGKSARQARYNPYLGEPHATISPSGTRVVFGSDWYDSGSVDSYVIELPGYRSPRIRAGVGAVAVPTLPQTLPGRSRR